MGAAYGNGDIFGSTEVVLILDTDSPCSVVNRTREVLWSDQAEMLPEQPSAQCGSETSSHELLAVHDTVI